nr:receptor-like kinase TMK4 [Ipomoea batatas]
MVPPPTIRPRRSMAYAKALFLFLLSNLLTVSFCDDAAVMSKLLAALSPAPSGWSASKDPCSWTNVNCDNSTGNVVSINLDSQSISGNLPSEITQLASLRSLSVQKNSLSGPLPSFANMSSLQELYLDSNEFSSIPQDFLLGLPNLRTFNISDNDKLSPWQIPGYLTESINLGSFYASNASITGPIPDLSKCVNLSDLQLRDNQLIGIVPVSITGLPKLVNITLQNNNLQGPIPDFGNNVKINVDGNSFCKDTPGPCDPQVTALLAFAGGLGFPIMLTHSWEGNDACNSWKYISCDEQGNVITVNLELDDFSGTISPALANLTSLRNLYLDNNNLSGPIPENLNTLPNLQVLDVSNNHLSGLIPYFPSSVKVNTDGNLFTGKVVSPGGGSPVSDAPIPSDIPLSGNSNGSSISAGMIVGVVISVVIVVVVVLFVSYKCYMKRQHKMKIITGKKAIDETLPDETCHLVTWFHKIIIRKGYNIRNAIDPTLDLDDQTFESISKVAELAAHCTANKYFRRPNMEHVVNVLGPFAQKWKPLRPEEIEEKYGGLDLHMSLPLIAFDDSSIQSLSFSEAQLNGYRLNQSAQF